MYGMLLCLCTVRAHGVRKIKCCTYIFFFPEKDAFFQCPQTFLEVGDVVHTPGVGVSMGLQDIWKEDGKYRCSGFVVDGGGDVTDFCISGPTQKVEKVSLNISRSAKQTLKKYRKKAFEACQERFRTDFRYRKAVRAGHLRQLALDEVGRALKSKTRKRSFSFGVASLDVDLELFGLDFLDKRRKVFSIREGNFYLLDCIFGSDWDLMKGDNCFYFVTNFLVTLTSKNVLKAVVWTACCPHICPDSNVRQFVREFVQQV